MIVIPIKTGLYVKQLNCQVVNVRTMNTGTLMIRLNGDLVLI